MRIPAYTIIQLKPEGILNRLFKVQVVFFREDKSHLPHPDYGFYELERKVKADPSYFMIIDRECINRPNKGYYKVTMHML